MIHVHYETIYFQNEIEDQWLVAVWLWQDEYWIYLVMFGESVVVKDGKDQGLVERFTVRNLKVKIFFNNLAYILLYTAVEVKRNIIYFIFRTR